MGCGSSTVAEPTTKTIYLSVEGAADVSVAFSSSCLSQDVKDVLLSAAGLNRWSAFTLTDKNGSFLAISPSLTANTPSTPYKLSQVTGSEDTDKEVFHKVLSKVGDEFSKAFKMHEFQDDVSERLRNVETRLQVEGVKAVETDSCKQEPKQLNGSLPSDKLQQKAALPMPRAGLKRGVPPYPKYTLTTETEEYLKKPTFDIWHWEPNEMISLLEHMYQELGLVAHLHMNHITLRTWLLEIQKNYRDNPFHNFRHCFSVTQMMYGMIHQCHLRDHLSQLDLAMLMTAAICHDLDHPGFSNSYQINARTELAVRYNDISPLENHHCAVTFQILETPETNIFAYVSAEDFKNIRKGMIDLILATDMSRHSELLGKWTAILDSGLDYSNEEHVKMLKVMLIKCCDISNEVRPVEVAEPWLDCLLQEYFQQSDREKTEGLPVTSFMDRDKVTKSSAQIGFIRFVLLPLFESMCRVFPQLEKVMVATLRSSLERYEKVKEEEEEEKEEKEEEEEEASTSHLVVKENSVEEVD